MIQNSTISRESNRSVKHEAKIVVEKYYDLKTTQCGLHSNNLHLLVLNLLSVVTESRSSKQMKQVRTQTAAWGAQITSISLVTSGIFIWSCFVVNAF